MPTDADFARLFTDAAVGIYRIDATGRYLDANPAMARMHGFDRPDAFIAHFNAPQHQHYADPEARTADRKSVV